MGFMTFIGVISFIGFLGPLNSKLENSKEVDLKSKSAGMFE